MVSFPLPPTIMQVGQRSSGSEAKLGAPSLVEVQVASKRCDLNKMSVRLP